MCKREEQIFRRTNRLIFGLLERRFLPDDLPVEMNKSTTVGQKFTSDDQMPDDLSVQSICSSSSAKTAKPSAWWRSPWRCRRGLLKVSITEVEGDTFAWKDTWFRNVNWSCKWLPAREQVLLIVAREDIKFLMGVLHYPPLPFPPPRERFSQLISSLYSYLFSLWNSAPSSVTWDWRNFPFDSSACN